MARTAPLYRCQISLLLGMALVGVTQTGAIFSIKLCDQKCQAAFATAEKFLKQLHAYLIIPLLIVIRHHAVTLFITG